MVKEEPKARIRIKFRGHLAAGLLVLLVVQQAVSASRAWVVVIVALGLLLGVGYLWARALATQVVCRRRLRYGWVQVGDRLEETFTLRNDSPWPVLWAEVVDRSDLAGYTVGRVAAVDPHAEVRWSAFGECHRRGLFTLGPWELQMSDPFGLFEVSQIYPETMSLLVYPPVVHLPTLELPKGAAEGRALARFRARQWTANAAGVRDYQPGDPVRRIHWPSTARRGKLLSKLFDLEVSGDLWLLLDRDEAVEADEGEESTAEYGVTLAASLADRMLRQGRAVGLAVYGEQPVLLPPGRGQGHLWQVLRALATVSVGGRWPLARAIAETARLLRRGTTLVVITPSADPAWAGELLPLARRDVAGSVILLDGASFGGTGNVEAMRGLLADQGVTSHVIRQGFPFRHLMPLQRRGHWEFKTLASGRVIVTRRPNGRRG
jgi:uncharacterized protein (DUF58 family)